MNLVTAWKQHLLDIRTVKDIFRTTKRLRSRRSVSKDIRDTDGTSRSRGKKFLGSNRNDKSKSKLSNELPIESFNTHPKYSLTSKEMIIAKFLTNNLKVQETYIINEVWKHPKRKFININEVKKSLKFLQDEGFSNYVIADSAAVCFYPKMNIMQGFEEIKRNESELSKIGLVNGFTRNTSEFCCGSKVQDKRLQLCLYYMELPFAFNGSGIFHSS